ncbi:ATP-binding protein [[Mycoplasma] testudinis]|uniref:ATP-binding protein n=1 Tax=[Mycoplasma] testudinis TaxID=33924 RepID=UPI00055B1C9A|nr:DUF4143 domain-containing protein [[Mycoplasma] testudinis]
MKLKNYWTRLIEEKIKEKLRITGGVHIMGPKYCGKTTTAKLFCESYYNLTNSNYLQLLDSNSVEIFGNSYPVLIDEWQMLPKVWDQIKIRIDNESKNGMYLLTGSASPINKKQIYHSGAGRIVTIKMRPMSLYESGESLNLISFKKLFNQTKIKPFLHENTNFNILDTFFLMCRGGWPEIVFVKNRSDALSKMQDYFSALLDFGNLEGSKYKKINVRVLSKIIKSFSRNVSTEASIKTILNDIVDNLNEKISEKTLLKYIAVLKDIFLLEELEAWNPNYRSKTIFRTSPTHHFVDTSIACAALNLTPEKLIHDFNTAGFLFEDFVIRDLRIYADYLNGNIYKYREEHGLECDAVMSLKKGDLALIQIKIGSSEQINLAAKSLLKIQQKMIKDNAVNANFVKPKFLMVITATGNAYVRDDGIIVTPLNMLGV